jgi:hypothetical protein
MSWIRIALLVLILLLNEYPISIFVNDQELDSFTISVSRLIISTLFILFIISLIPALQNILLIMISLILAYLILEIMNYIYKDSLYQAHEVPSVPFLTPYVDSNCNLYTTHTKNWHWAGYEFGQFYATLKRDDFKKIKVEVKTDNYGLRNSSQEVYDYPENIIMGDSFAFGYHLDQKDHFVTALNNAGVKTLNIGVYGVSPSNQYILLKHLLDNNIVRLSSTKVSLLFFGGNDFTDLSAYNIGSCRPYLFQFKLFVNDFYQYSIANRIRMILFYNNRKNANNWKTIDGKYFPPIYFDKLSYSQEKLVQLYDKNLLRFFNDFNELLKIDSISEVNIIYVPSRPEIVKNNNLQSVFLKQRLGDKRIKYYDLRNFSDLNIDDYHVDDTHLNAHGHNKLFNFFNNIIENK